MDAAKLHALVETCLMWIGYGVVAGTVAKVIMPGRDPGGTMVTLFLGIAGALLGATVFAGITGGRLRDLISLPGFAVSVGGALVLLISHRVLSGRVFRSEGRVVEEVIVPSPVTRRRRTIRRSDAA